MNGKVETSLKQLSSLSKSLNEASDELSKQISAIESALNEFKLGIWAWVKEPILTESELSDPDEKGQQFLFNYHHCLGYGKHKGKWGLLVSYGWEGEDEEEIMFLRDVTQEASKKASEAKELAAALNSKKSR